VFEPGEFDDLQPASTKTIGIEDFVELEAIDLIYFERIYYLAPDGNAATKGYALLSSVMNERRRVSIGKGRDARQAIPRGHPALRTGSRALDDVVRR
jgi:DNA end-binding protein Ku